MCHIISYRLTRINEKPSQKAQFITTNIAQLQDYISAAEEAAETRNITYYRCVEFHRIFRTSDRQTYTVYN